MKLIPYLFFKGEAEAALKFYEAAGLGKIASLSRYREAPSSDHAPPGDPDWVMNASLIGDGFEMMVSDGGHAEPMKGVSLSIGLTDLDRARALFAALSDGGIVTMPMSRQFWGADFGMFTDRFGVQWMVNCDGPGEQ